MDGEIELYFVAAIFAGVAAFGAWEYFRGQTVGAVKGLLQGESSVRGAPLRITVKRHPQADGLFADVEVQFRVFGLAQVRRMDADTARRFAETLREAQPWVRGEP